MRMCQPGAIGSLASRVSAGAPRRRVPLAVLTAAAVMMVAQAAIPLAAQDNQGEATRVEVAASAASATAASTEGLDELSIDELIDTGVERLVGLSEDDGAWPYEGVYRVSREIPVGYRVGGTAIVCEALIYHGATDNDDVRGAIREGIERMLVDLEHPLMEPSVRNTYDVRVWGHIYALDFFCRLQTAEGFEEEATKTAPWIPKLTEYLLTEQLDDGGWNYANRRAHAAFVTVPAIQALLWARASGQEIESDVFDRAKQALLDSRAADGAYTYSGSSESGRRAQWPGAIARAAGAEATLIMLGEDRTSELQTAIEMFHEHWEELEKRRQQTGTHLPPYGVAPYYFYYGHRYVSQAIRYLPDDIQAHERSRFTGVLEKTRDEDGTWNDRVFARSKAYGTAMSLLSLGVERVDLPPSLN